MQAGYVAPEGLGQQQEEPRQLSALEQSGYRRATKAERAEMQSHPAVQTMMKMLHNEPFDAIIPQ